MEKRLHAINPEYKKMVALGQMPQGPLGAELGRKKEATTSDQVDETSNVVDNCDVLADEMMSMKSYHDMIS